MRLAILAAVAACCAGAALARQPGRAAAPVPAACNEPIQAVRGFVENLHAAKAALDARDWRGTLDAAALARPHARSGQQRSAIVQVEVEAYKQLDDYPALLERMDIGIGDTCMPWSTRKQYMTLRGKLRAGTPEPSQ